MISEMSKSEIESLLKSLNAVNLRDKLSDEEIIEMLGSTHFNSLCQDHKELVWQSISAIFGEELRVA